MKKGKLDVTKMLILLNFSLMFMWLQTLARVNIFWLPYFINVLIKKSKFSVSSR